ncbi:8-amino-7-oxononanoate synthase [Baaleninema sp.]|uniref:8-amino-7-oxononanoate synthase n=1 Tax=Baaleninema sp. TaxID=3101197 RepID=UPI003D090498
MVYRWIDKSLKTIHKANWYRSPTEIDGRPGAEIQLDGRRFINFASNDYLGLAGDDRLVNAAVDATNTYGTGSSGSRLLSGHRPLHRQLEAAIAAFKQTEDAVVFSSGYLANLGTLAALVDRRDVIFADTYNHSSLKNGALLSGATVFDYPHNDLDALTALLQQHRSHYRRCLIVTDSVFSMDGDICQLPELLDLGDRFECMVMVDEAHGTGVFGDRGSGCVEYFGCRDRPLIQMGTLSKALGSLGGYVAGSSSLVEFLRNRAPTWIYTTGLSPADTAAALRAIEILQKEPQRRAKLWENVNALKQRLTETLPPQFQLLPSNSPIICVRVKDAATVLALGKTFRDAGLFVSAVRPPTVPSSRLRVTLMATHERHHLDRLIEIFLKLK